jgi:hypothetical protein
MLADILNQLKGDPHFLPLAAILAVIVIARLVGQGRKF